MSHFIQQLIHNKACTAISLICLFIFSACSGNTQSASPASQVQTESSGTDSATETADDAGITTNEFDDASTSGSAGTVATSLEDLDTGSTDEQMTTAESENVIEAAPSDSNNLPQNIHKKQPILKPIKKPLPPFKHHPNKIKTGVSSTDTESASENTNETEVEVATQTEPAAEVTTQTEPAAEVATQTEPAAEAATQTEPAAEAATQTEPAAEAATQTEPAAEVATQTEPAAEAATQTEPAAEVATQTEPAAEAATQTEPESQTVISLSIFSHVEEKGGSGDDYTPNLYDSLSDYKKFRDSAKAIGDYAVQNSIPWSIQSDYNFIKGILNFDEGTNPELKDTTQGLNILAYLETVDHLSIDAHSHQHSYNESDNHYMLTELGVSDGVLVGGSTVDQEPESYLSMKGLTYKDHEHSFSLIMGGGSPSHTGDTNVSGFFFSQGADNFLGNNPNGQIATTGGIHASVNNIRSLISSIESGQLPANHIYTTSLSIDLRRVVNKGESYWQSVIADQVEPLIALQKEYESGPVKVQFMTFQNAYQMWMNEYGKESYICVANENAETRETATTDVLTLKAPICTPMEWTASTGTVDNTSTSSTSTTSTTTSPQTKPIGGTLPGAKPTDGVLPDAKPADGSLPDAKPADGALPDAKPTDGTLPESMPADGVLPTTDTTSQLHNQIVTLAFAADFSKGTGCAAPADVGCDIYQADLDLNTGDVKNLVQITDSTNGDSHPHWLADGSGLYFTESPDTNTHRTVYFNATTAQVSTVLENSAYFQKMGMGTALMQQIQKNVHSLAKASLSTDGTKVSKIFPVLTLNGFNIQEPHASNDGQYVIFHAIPTSGDGSTRSQGKLLRVATGEQLDFTDADGSGHCAINPSATYGVCDNWEKGGLIGRSIGAQGLGSLELTVADMPVADFAQSVDSDFKDCSTVSVNYPSYCGDDNHLMVSVSCQQAGKDDGTPSSGIAFTRLVLIDMSSGSPVYHPVGRALSELFGGMGSNSWTSDCRMDASAHIQ